MPTRPCLPALRTLTGVAALFIAFAFVATEPARAASAADECDRLAAHPADGEKPIAVTGSIDIPQQDIVDAVRLCKEAAEAAGAPRRM